MVSKQQNLMAFQTLAGERLDQLSKKEDQITNQIDTYIGEIIAQIKRKQEEFHQTVRQVVGVRKREVNRKVSKSSFSILSNWKRKNSINLLKFPNPYAVSFANPMILYTNLLWNHY